MRDSSFHQDSDARRRSIEVSNSAFIDLWDRFYDETTLERLDLREERKIVEENRHMTTLSFFQKLFPNIPGESLEELSNLAGGLLDVDVSEEDRSLLFFNLIPVVYRHLKEGDIEMIESLAGFVGNERWRELPARSFPDKVLIELTNNCNLNCVMCGVGAHGYDPSRTMDISRFENLIQMLGSKASSIRLNGLGESTVIPDFQLYLDVVRDCNSKLELVTNLAFENQDIVRRLLEMDFLIFISCDSTDDHRLSRIRRGIDLEAFTQNLEVVSDFIQERQERHLDSQIIMTLMKSNFHELPDMIDFAARYNIGGVIANMVKGDGGDWKVKRLQELKDVFRRAHARAERNGILLKVPDQIEGIPLAETYVSKSNTSECTTNEKEIFIRYNGDVCPCNMMNPYIYGNVGRSSVDEILNGINARVFHYLTTTGSRHPYCVNCYYME
jgi:radical SAM protein with 4Fe4S-binding SPASM domain